MRIEKLRSTWNVQLDWRFFPLHPETPDDGLALEELFRPRGYDLARMHGEMKDRMDSEGLEYGHRTHTYNSRLAQELAKWADSRPGHEAIHDRLYRAYFVDGRNISDPETLITVAVSVGLPADEARRVLSDRLFREAVDEDWMRARRYGIRGVPTFVCDGKGAVGAQPYETLEQLVVEAGATRRDPTSME